ncbi:MAG: alpha-ribazole phosphatase [Bacteroidetes bacterium]|nr:MAG: alpha-ribazole phosphatase [Bacteroidota bacterium]
MNITLIRHTKVAVKKGICYGQSDVGLANSFEEEKAVIKNKVKLDDFDIVYSSPLKRCKILAGALFSNKEIIYDNRLMELNFGDWEGKHWDDISKTSQAKAFFKEYVKTTCPGGESYRDLINRISRFYQEIKSKHASKQVAIVCHGGSIRAFISVIEGISPQQAFEQKIDYGQVITF